MYSSFKHSEVSTDSSVPSITPSSQCSITDAEATTMPPVSSPVPSVKLPRRPSTIIINGYRPPWPVKYFFHTLIEVIWKDYDQQIRISIVVENFRTLFYWFFLFTVLLGMFLTKAFAKTGSATILTNVFGASNICAYFDFPPATYFLPFFWIFPMFAAVTFDIVSMFRIWIANAEGRITKKSTKLLFLAHIYFIFSIMVFSTIFAVSPDRDEPVTMLVHALPYINLKIAMFVLQLAVVWFGTKVSWRKLKFPGIIRKDCFIAFSWAHVILQCIIMLVSNITIINALGDMGEANLVGKGLWWNVHSDHSMNTFSDIFTNKASFFLNILYPLMQSQYLGYRGAQNIADTHAVVISIKNKMQFETT